MQRDDVARLEQRVELGALGAGRGERLVARHGIAREHAHAERGGVARHEAADLAEADHAEHGAAHAPRRAGRALLPHARLHRAVEPDDAAQAGQRAGEREVGDLAAAVVGRAVGGHAGGAQVVEIHVVVARRAGDRHARARVRGEQVGVDRDAAAGDDARRPRRDRTPRA